MPIQSDIQISRQAQLEPIYKIASKLGIAEKHLIPFGHTKAKIDKAFIETQEKNKDGKLILVTAMSPTTKGEGKTTITVGLGDGLNKIGKKALICLREPSLGPCFGMKGGAAGGGYSQVVPMEDINLHFTGDFHAITTAHNLLSALIDNHVYWGNHLEIDSREITWRRVMDVNDRALREMILGLDKGSNGIPRETGFDITVASEIMAILCLANSFEDLERRLAKIVVAKNIHQQYITAKDLKASGALSVLLKDAILPNLVQTLENNPAFIHGGPFANIAHGCNSVIATKLALKISDYVVTEAGFGADLGAEKFFNIKCRKAGLSPNACVIVVTVRALKSHGGLPEENLQKEDLDALRLGLSNLDRHIDNIRKFGVPVAIAINCFNSDTEQEIEAIKAFCQQKQTSAFECTNWLNGSQGITGLAEYVAKLADSSSANFKTLYPDELTLWEKIKTVAKEIYDAKDIRASEIVKNKLKSFEEAGYGQFPVCIAKTQYSFSSDPLLKGAPSQHILDIRDVRLAAGAEFIVAICGDIMTMPGLPRQPCAERILIKDGKIEGLF